MSEDLTNEIPSFETADQVIEKAGVKIPEEKSAKSFIPWFLLVTLFTIFYVSVFGMFGIFGDKFQSISKIILIGTLFLGLYSLIIFILFRIYHVINKKQTEVLQDSTKLDYKQNELDLLKNKLLDEHLQKMRMSNMQEEMLHRDFEDEFNG